ncbi:MAG: phosphate ABC transporter substrate-binding protein [Thermoanaerobaculia bacterium]
MLLVGWLLASPLVADIAVVTEPSTAVDALDNAQARELWLGTVERVGGTRLTVADRSDAGIRADFYRLVLHKTRGQIKAIRSKRAFQHGIAPPPELPSDETVLRWVRAREGRLGYVDAETVDDSVKVLLVIEVPERSEQP